MILYNFRLDPHHSHDLYLTEGIVKLPRTHTDLLICTPAHELLSELLLARLIWLTVVDVVEGVDGRVVSRKMLLCVVFRLEVGEVELVRLRDVDEQEEEDDGHPNGDPDVDVQE